MKTAVFPGSFDPFTFAHKDIVDRSLPFFDTIYIAIGVNPSKAGLMDFELRKMAIASLYQKEDRVVVETYKGLTVDFCQKVKASAIIRGLRNTKDFEFESPIAQNNLLLAPSIESFFMICRSGLGHVSSTIVRDILSNGGAVDQLVPKEILNFIK